MLIAVSGTCSPASPIPVRAYGTVTTAQHPRPVVVLEALPGRTVDRLIQECSRLRSGDLALLGLHLGAAVGYLHHQDWLHLGIQPANVVNTDGRVVLLDLSLVARPGGTSQPPPLPTRRRPPRALAEVIHACLHLDPGERPPLQEVVEGLTASSGIDLRAP